MSMDDVVVVLRPLDRAWPPPAASPVGGCGEGTVPKRGDCLQYARPTWLLAVQYAGTGTGTGTVIYATGVLDWRVFGFSSWGVGVWRTGWWWTWVGTAGLGCCRGRMRGYRRRSRGGRWRSRGGGCGC